MAAPFGLLVVPFVFTSGTILVVFALGFTVEGAFDVETFLGMVSFSFFDLELVFAGFFVVVGFLVIFPDSVVDPFGLISVIVLGRGQVKLVSEIQIYIIHIKIY